MKTMSLKDAAGYQPCFDAVLAGTATLAQATECDAIINLVHRYMQGAGVLATAMMEGRAAAKDDGATPRLTYDPDAEDVFTPSDIAAKQADRAAAKAAEDAAALADKAAADKRAEEDAVLAQAALIARKKAVADARALIAAQ